MSLTCLRPCGYRVLRFWNHEVLANTEGVLETIRAELLLARNRPD